MLLSPGAPSLFLEGIFMRAFRSYIALKIRNIYIFMMYLSFDHVRDVDALLAIKL